MDILRYTPTVSGVFSSPRKYHAWLLKPRMPLEPRLIETNHSCLKLHIWNSECAVNALNQLILLDRSHNVNYQIPQLGCRLCIEREVG
jgi:hypothetical protein